MVYKLGRSQVGMKVNCSIPVLIWGLFLSGITAHADKLVVLSPHRKSIQDEFVPKFKEHYKKTYKTEVQVDWLDQGGTSDDLRFIKAKWQQDPQKTGVDLFWGGGTATFLDLSESGILAPFSIPKELDALLPSVAAGVPLRDANKHWYATALSSFGIFFNKYYLKARKLPEPKTWADLAHPQYRNLLSLADPRRSGTASSMNMIVIQGLGWEKGWHLLHELAGNNRAFTHSSSDPIKNISAGDAAVSMAIDFYALSKVAEVGETKLGFTLPEGLTVLDPDPVGIIQHAPNRQVAERFVRYILSEEAQKLLVLNKGEADGPRFSTLGRMSVNTAVYASTEGRRLNSFNPFKVETMLQVDADRAAKVRRVFDDLLGSLLIDTHADLKSAWLHVSQLPVDHPQRIEFGKIPISEEEAFKLAEKWDDNVLRNQKINEWVEIARTRFRKLAQKKS